MHIFFSGIGGSGLTPLALIAKQAGYEVSGSDIQDSQNITLLKKAGLVNINIGQTKENISNLHQLKPIDWIVYTVAVPMQNPDHPELLFAIDNHIKCTKRDEFINEIITINNLKLIAIAGTHGKTTTTAMVIWLLLKLKLPISYLLPAKSSFAEMGYFDPKSSNFIYECDEYDHNFLSFTPHISLISGIDWDHADIYPTRKSYNQAFRDFIAQSNHTIIWPDDAEKLKLPASSSVTIIEDGKTGLKQIKLAGEVNRANGWLAVYGVRELARELGWENKINLIDEINLFPGISRRFEKLAPNIYTDYAHTVPKIRGALQLAKEIAPDRLVVVYEGLHNTRQHFIIDDLYDLFAGIKKLYVVPSYLAREDQSLAILTPSDLIERMSSPKNRQAVLLNDKLWSGIQAHANNGDLVLALSAGGGHSLDEWLRTRLSSAEKQQ